jgi:hypothetical protein
LVEVQEAEEVVLEEVLEVAEVNNKLKIYI